jgi:hypothetical protein
MQDFRVNSILFESVPLAVIFLAEELFRENFIQNINQLCVKHLSSFCQFAAW